MDYKRFASHGHDNPHSMESVKRTLRSYPAKRNTWGKAKSEALKKKKEKSIYDNLREPKHDSIYDKIKKPRAGKLKVHPVHYGEKKDEGY